MYVITPISVQQFHGCRIFIIIIIFFLFFFSTPFLLRFVYLAGACIILILPRECVYWLIWPNANYSNIIIIMRRVFYYRYYRCTHKLTDTHTRREREYVFPPCVLCWLPTLFLFLFRVSSFFAMLYFNLLFFSSLVQLVFSAFARDIYTHCTHTMCNFRHGMEWSTVERQMYKWMAIKETI